MRIDPRLESVLNAYDVRGRSPGDLDEEVVTALGVAFAEETEISRGRGAAVVGHDMRGTSPDLARSFIDGITSVGGSAVEIGLASTDLLYFASGAWELPGVMVTASHNPAAYNGLKLCRVGARPIGRDSGLHDMAVRADAVLRGPRPGRPPEADVSSREALSAYAARVHELVPAEPGRLLTVVVDAGNGMAGHTVPAVFEGLEVDLVPLYFELDGTFPHHDANPLDSSTLTDLRAAVLEHGADIGLAFDGDADRCFVVDERGHLVTPSAVTGLIAQRHLGTDPGATVLHNVICSKAVREIILEHGGIPVRTPVGHSLIKAEMARTGAIFGGEHSGHFYFRDFFLADSGMLAALHVLAALASSGGPLSELMGGYERYAASGEINSTVDDASAVVETIAAAYSSEVMDRLDGLTVNGGTWWFNVRASNTEPLLRLNVEGDDDATMARVRDEVLALIRKGGQA